MNKFMPTIIIGGGDEGTRLALDYFRKEKPFYLFEMAHELGGLERVMGKGLGEEVYQTLEKSENVYMDTTVQGLTETLELVVQHDSELFRVKAGEVFLCTGNREAPILFPGWTLPGVIQSHAAKMMFYRDGIVPGFTIFYLHQGGADKRFLADLQKKRVKVLDCDAGNLQYLEVVRLGEEKLEISLKLKEAPSVKITVDAIVTEGTMSPNHELLEMAKGKVQVAPGPSGMISTTVERLFLAKLTTEIESPLKLMKLADEYTNVCRCEDVTVAEIKESIGKGATTHDDIKRMTRCGMGACQWKTCREPVSALLLKYAGLSGSAPNIRFPLIPIPLEILATLPSYETGKLVDILVNSIAQQAQE